MAETLCVAAAQTASVTDDLGANLHTHQRFIQAAARAGVQLLVFPELSLCGYELPQLERHCLAADDARLNALHALAMAHRMTVLVGAPVHSADPQRPHIGAITLRPTGDRLVHHKQFLHPGEDRFAAPGLIASADLDVAHTRAAVAICADITHAEHAQSAAMRGAALYLASVLVSKAGYAADSAHLQARASQHDMGVLMANHAAPSGGFDSAGRSAFLAPGGKLVVEAPGPGECLVVARRCGSSWQGEVITPVTSH